MLTVVRTLNLAVRLVLELAVLAAAAYMGFTLDDADPVRALAGVGGPLILIVVWSLWGAPRARFKLSGGAHLVLDIVWFGAGAAALLAAGRPGWAAALVVIYLINTILIFAWKQA
jgi:hypothetical protein